MLSSALRQTKWKSASGSVRVGKPEIPPYRPEPAETRDRKHWPGCGQDRARVMRQPGHSNTFNGARMVSKGCRGLNEVTATNG
ncbi:unnamed protein product [Protopolystoma xenopodis]|uniref:Uncharacterized protein n=1 Tax=Protopolystoma xenopodis TaxID=117903 RepID=A0A448XLG7_9PLAT|nr:unnamed protein product [Protopolystoma xenopodis]